MFCTNCELLSPYLTKWMLRKWKTMLLHSSQVVIWSLEVRKMALWGIFLVKILPTYHPTCSAFCTTLCLRLDWRHYHWYNFDLLFYLQLLSFLLNQWSLHKLTIKFQYFCVLCMSNDEQKRFSNLPHWPIFIGHPKRRSRSFHLPMLLMLLWDAEFFYFVNVSFIMPRKARLSHKKSKSINAIHSQLNYTAIDQHASSLGFTKVSGKVEYVIISSEGGYHN